VFKRTELFTRIDQPDVAPNAQRACVDALHCKHATLASSSFTEAHVRKRLQFPARMSPDTDRTRKSLKKPCF
jgi:hypothetical protein